MDPGRCIKQANQTVPLVWTVAQYMNHRSQPPIPAVVCRTGIRLLLGLIPYMVAAAPLPALENRGSIRSRPYLAVIGPSQLRFQEAAPTSNLSARLPAGAPPLLANKTPSSDEDETEETEAVETSHSSDLAPEIQSADHVSPTAVHQEKANPAYKRILPDESRPKVRAEDFLPFFEFPGTKSNPNDVSLTPTPPAPGQLPPSSATYRQQ